MRLPWPFGRAQRSPSEGGAASSGASGGGSARPGGGPGSPERGQGDAWRTLPPLGETVGPPPLVAPNRPFAAALAASEPPAPILAPLSHGKSLEAPRGLVAGVAKPVAMSRGAELPRPVQRSPLSAKRDVEAASFATFDDAQVPEAAASASVPPSVPAPATVPPVRKLEAIAAAARPAANALTRAPEPALARPLGLVGAARVSRAGVQRSPEPAPAPTPVQAAPIPAPMAPPAPTPRPEPDRDRPRLSIGQARRLGLGTPIAGGPISPSAPPFAGASIAAPALAASDRSRAAPEPAGIQRSSEMPDLDLPLATRPTPAPSAPSGAQETRTPPPATEPSQERAPVTARRVGPAAHTAAGPTSPILSAQPLRARVQRAPLALPARPVEAGSASTVVAPAPAGGAAGAPVTVHRDSSAAQLAKSIDARSFTHGGDIYLPASHGPLSSGKGRSLLAHELTHVTQQRRLGSSLPEEHTPHGKALEAEAVAAERGADMPLAASASGSAAPAKPAPATVGAAADRSAPAPAHAMSSSAGPSATGPAQRAPANGPGGEPGGGRQTHSEQELEDLAGQLYARIGRQLRRELLVDRERAGFAMDLG